MARIPIMVFCFFLLTTGAYADTVKLGIYPSNNPAKLQQVMDVFAAYLEAETGDTVEVIVTRDYNELMRRIQDSSTDIAWLNTLNYVRLKNDLPAIKYISTYVERNEITGSILPFYQSYIVTRNDSGITSLDEGHGKLFAFTDSGSTSGYAFPNMLLRKNGIDPDRFFKKVIFLKKHDRVAEALRKGAIDVGAMSDGTYFTVERKYGDIFRILAKSDPIPLDAIVANETVSEEKVLLYRKALQKMPHDHPFCKNMREILGWSAAGFETRDDSFYDSVRQALGD